MKETKKDNITNQKLYRIRIYKDFEFPSFSINQDNTIADLLNKSMEELSENYSAESYDYFDHELIQVMPFSLEKELPKLSSRFNTNFNFAIREIAINDVEQKYGKLNYESNPSIFDKRTKSNGESIDPRSPYHLKGEVEDYYSERVQHYANILENKLL